jgi:hypothetical protein
LILTPLLLAALVLLLCSCSSPIQPPSRILLGGQRLARLDSWDIVHPRFSPEGDRLAFAKSEVEEGMETTELAILDFASGSVTTLLDPQEAKRYAAYKAYVFELDWTDATHVRAAVSDGDVGATYLTYDVASRRLVDTRNEEEAAPAPPDRALEELIPDCVRALPTLPPEVLESALARHAVLVGNRRAILQKDHAGQDDDIWLIDCGGASMTRLLGMGSEDHDALGGGVTLGSSSVFLVSRKSGATLMLLKDGRVTELATVPGKARHMRIEVKHTSPERVYFLVRAQATSEAGDNPLFAFDGQRLQRVVDFEDLYDFDMTRDRRLAAFCAWRGDRRILEIRRLMD